MLFGKKLAWIVSVSLVLVINTPIFAGWKDGIKAVKVSGGEDHTLVLTKDGFVG